MEKLQHDQFSVAILPPATAYHPVDGRKYTLIMSTGEMNCHLAIGFKYETDLLNVEKNVEKEKVITAEWKPRLGEYVLTGKIDLGSLNNFHLMQAELAKAISMMVKADKGLYTHVPWLLDAPIYMEIDSYIHKYKTIQYFGTPRQYLK